MGHNCAMLPLLSVQHLILVRSENIAFLSVRLTFLHLVACVWLVTFVWKQCQEKTLMRGGE